MRKPKEFRNKPSLLDKYELRRVKKEHMKIVAIDFDGTIVSNNYPYCENPNKSVVGWIKSNMDNYIMILWTCRVGEQLKMALEYCDKVLGIKFDYVNRNCAEITEAFGSDCRKIFANYYVDDKSCFIKNNELHMIV